MHALKRPEWPRAAASCAVFREGAVLLVKRGAGSARPGVWSLPGGHIEPGERADEAAAREVFEETGIVTRIVGLVGVHDALIRNRDGVLTAHYVIAVHAGRYVSGDAIAASDAAEARFVALERIESHPLTDGAKDLILSAAARVLR
jgi:ADP-ribose pyrophosphatase YjhB (NUDIX family)